MASDIIHTEIDGQPIKLSNLDKILFPEISLTKAEFIQYYLNIAPILLKYIRNRPLTLVRYPDGIEGKRFYSKEKPQWTPEWINSYAIQHEEKKIRYILAEDKASIVWLANLASIELHPMQFMAQNNSCPDYFVFDLDPDISVNFEQVKETAILLKRFLEQYDYTPFIKTSGGKGLHIIVPIKPIFDYDTVTAAVKILAKLFITQYPQSHTLEINKEKRIGKILIDIYRNYLTNTTVSVFSVRGKPGAPISMPIFWEDLKSLLSSQQFTIQNYTQYLEEKGNAWENWRQGESTLHNQQEVHAVNTDLRLESYLEKRNFEFTSEPGAKINHEHKNQYVIQLHDASNLHYDLRLEDRGVLLSWAIPKGLPNEKGIKRLAVKTEDHPVRYLDFEGVIPKGQYGAGKMWIMEKANIEWIEKKENHYKFILEGNKSYNLYHTKEDLWLIENIGEPTRFNSSEIKPMLADSSDKVPSPRQYSYEVKWDGIRVMIFAQNGSIKIISRGGRDITKHFPGLVHHIDLEVESAVLDAEIVVLDKKGKPVFSDVISRMHTVGDAAIKKATRSKPVTCYVFDMVCLDGRMIDKEPLSRRREWLEVIVKWNPWYRFSNSFQDGRSLFKAIEQKGMEGIMAKKKDGKYCFGKRTNNWIKIKVRAEDTAFIIGYTKGKGDRQAGFGALQLAKKEENSWKYMGKVGTGFDTTKMKEIINILNQIPRTKKLIVDKIDDERNTIWIEPLYSCKLKYASMSSNQTYREPVFIKIIKEKIKTD